MEYVLKSVHMYDRKDDNIGSFSGGMKQRIGIAQILLNLPRILVVDEPTAGLDPRERIRFPEPAGGAQPRTNRHIFYRTLSKIFQAPATR
jgi:ABC-type Mn2+/Zn2+ transport system ATPase subunit